MEALKYENSLNEAKAMVEDGKDLKEIRQFLRSQNINASKAQVKHFIKFVKGKK